jgi:hypothetical protein
MRRTADALDGDGRPQAAGPERGVAGSLVGDLLRDRPQVPVHCGRRGEPGDFRLVESPYTHGGLLSGWDLASLQRLLAFGHPLVLADLPRQQRRGQPLGEPPMAALRGVLELAVPVLAAVLYVLLLLEQVHVDEVQQ